MTHRDAGEIGAGLEPARAARRIPPGERIHVVGAGGAAAAAACLLAHNEGASASGCDAGGPSPYTPPLEDAGIPLRWSHDPAHVSRDGSILVDRLAVTKALTSVFPDHPELLAARSRSIPATSVQQLIADAAATRGSALVGVAGTHGKSTTTGWLLHLMTTAGLDPSGFVGALLPPALAGGARPSTVRLGRGRHFVVEADEYAGNFDSYRPVIGALTNADWDHPDVFADRAAVVAAFGAWIRHFDGDDEEPVLVANAGDGGVREVLAGLRTWSGRLVVVGVVGAGEDPGTVARALAAEHVTALGPATAIVGRWSVTAGEGNLEIAGLSAGDRISAPIGLPGRHNAENGLVAAGAALIAGARVPAIVAGLASFAGVGRRLELKGEIGGVVVLDDYGHHPTAMAATFAATAERYPGRRLWAVYEPLTFHRTAAMLDEFAEVLARADRVVIAEIHAGRDPDTTITSAQALADAVNARGGAPAAAPGSVESTAAWLARRVEPGDVVLVMGGGRSYVVAERLVASLQAQAAGAGRSDRPVGGEQVPPMSDPSIQPDDDPRQRLAAALGALTVADLGRLAAAWTPELRDELRLADLVLSEHARGDLTHVVGPLLDRIPLLGAVVEESDDLAPHDRAGGEAALEVIEGAVMAVHAADLLTPERRARLAAPWLAARAGDNHGTRDRP